MKITCPNCETRFRVPDEALGPAGRTLKCARCDHRWHQAPSGAAGDDFDAALSRPTTAADHGPLAAHLEPAPPPPPMEEIGPDDDWGDEPAQPAEAEAPVGRGRTMLDDFPGDDVPLSREPGEDRSTDPRQDDDGPDFDDILARLEDQERERSGRAGGVAEDDDLFGDDDALPSALTSAQQEGPRRSGQGRNRKRPPAWASWATAVVVLLAGALGALYFLRNNVVAMMPESEALYTALGIPLDWPGLGLTLHEPKPVVTRELVDNEEVVVVRGFINNVSEVERPVPALRLALHDADGDMVQQMVAPPPAETLEPGGTTPFRMVMRNTLPQAKTFEVTFTDRPGEPMMAPPMETSSSQ